MNGFLVTETIYGAHLELLDYPLMPGDLLRREEDTGHWFKLSPGMPFGWFALTPEQEAKLQPVTYSTQEASVHLDEA